MNIILILCVLFFVYHIYNLIVKLNSTSTPLKISSVEKYKEIIKDLSKQQQQQQKHTTTLQLPSLDSGDNEMEMEDNTDTESVCSVGYLHLKHEMQHELQKLVRDKNI